MSFWSWLNRPSPNRDSFQAWAIRVAMIAVFVAIWMILRRL